MVARLLGFAWLVDPTLAPLARRTVMGVGADALAKALARGAFVALSVVYVAVELEAAPSAVATVFLVAGVFGVLGSLAGGFLADIVSPKQLLVVSSAGVACAYVGVLARPGVAWVTVAFALVALLDRAAASAQATWMGRGLPLGTATQSRALLRAVSNGGMAVGALLAAPLLVAGSPVPMGAAFVAMSLLEAVGLVALACTPAAVSLASGAVVRSRRAEAVRDTAFMLFVVGISALSTFYLVIDFLLPLWLTSVEGLSVALVPVAILVNTALVVLLQMRVAASAQTVDRAAVAIRRAGVLLLGAMLLLGSATLAAEVPIAGVALFVAGVVVLSVAEMLVASAGWTLGYAYARPENVGAYQGIFGTGTAIGVMVAPPLLTALVLELPWGMGAGWALLGVGYLLVGTAVWASVRQHRAGAEPGFAP